MPDLVSLRLRTAVLVGHLVLFEQFGHFLLDRFLIVGSGDDREFFASFGGVWEFCLLWVGDRLSGVFTHGQTHA